MRESPNNIVQKYKNFADERSITVLFFNLCENFPKKLHIYAINKLNLHRNLYTC
jgi:hypothetical protein